MVPKAIEGFRGAMEITTKAAGVTVSVAELLIEPEIAVIVVVPAPVLVAKPTVGEESLMVATFAAKDVQ